MCVHICVCVSVYVRCGVFWLHAKTSSYQEIDQRLHSLFLSVSICLSCSYFSQSFLPRALLCALKTLLYFIPEGRKLQLFLWKKRKRKYSNEKTKAIKCNVKTKKEKGNRTKILTFFTWFWSWGYQRVKSLNTLTLTFFVFVLRS